MHQNMLILLFQTPFDHFHFHPTKVPALMLPVCHMQPPKPSPFFEGRFFCSSATIATPRKSFFTAREQKAHLRKGNPRRRLVGVYI